MKIEHGPIGELDENNPFPLYVTNKNTTQDIKKELEINWKALIEEKHFLDSSSPPHFLYTLIERTERETEERIVEMFTQVPTLDHHCKCEGKHLVSYNAEDYYQILSLIRHTQ